ncbi:MAG: efflux RND transporter permease subunit [Bacillota bacterium]
MNISELSIKRPVTIIMCILIIVVLGAVSFVSVPIDLMPSMDFPMAVVITNYEGVGPQEVENFVTKTVESAVATVNNMKSIRSETSEGSSIVIVEFNEGTDMNFASLQMREKIDLVKGYFPEGVENPTVVKIDPNMLPVAQIGVTSKVRGEVELKGFVENHIKSRLERLDGVASVSVTGGVTREITVELDGSKMSNYGVNFNQVASTLQMENVNLPGGSVEYGNKNLIVKSKGEFSSVDSISRIPIVLPQGNIIYIRDISEVKDGYKDKTSYTRMDLQDSIGLSIQKQTTANTVEVVNIIKSEINKIKKDNPDVEINLSFDQGQYIEKSINDVTTNGIIGGFLAVLILFVFLRNIRTTLVIAIAIPVSVISTFVLMYLSKTTLNLISMGGLALGVGMMVDNAIVVLENIFRHRQEGKSRLESALIGAKEVGGAIIASTITTVVVFVPIIFTEGIAAEIFKEMAITVTFSLLASLAVALTIVPMLSSKMLKVSKGEKSRKNVLDSLLDLWERFFKSIDELYRRILRVVLNKRLVTLLIAGVIFVLSGTSVLMGLIGVEFISATDQGQFIVDIKLADGILLEETNKITSRVEEFISKIPEVDKMFVTVGGNGNRMITTGTESHTATVNVTLVSRSERKRSTGEIVEIVRKEVEKIPGADINVRNLSMSLGGGGGGSGLAGGDPVSIEISGDDLEQLKAIALEVEKVVKEVEGTRQIETSIAKGRPEAKVYVDRDKASIYGLSTMQVASTIRTSLQGQVATRYRISGDEVDVRIKLPDETKNTYEKLKDVKVLSPLGINVPLGDIVKIDVEEGPASIERRNQTRYVTVTADLFKRDVGSANSEIQEKLARMPLPDGYNIEYGGQNAQIRDSFSSLLKALLLSILLIYMVMAAQFESLSQPFIVMFSVPLAFSGAALGLAVTGRTLNVASFIGVIMLSGIVVNNAILLIDYINQLRSSGVDRDEAVIKAGPTRLRPILMTTLTTVLGMIPLALGIGEGAEMQAPLATVVIFGLTLSTMLTLLVIPVIYTLFDDIYMKLKGKAKQSKDTVSYV